MKEESTSDPKAHVSNIKGELNELIEHLRRDVNKVSDPRARALFETSAEVLQGLKKAYEDFGSGSESAWH